MMGLDQLFPGQVVDVLCQPLAEAAAVDEHDGALMLVDLLEEAGVDGGPDPVLALGGVFLRGQALRGAHVGCVGLRCREGDGQDRTGHVLHRDLDGQVQIRRGGRVDDPHGPVAPEEAADLIQGICGGGEADPLGLFVGDP